MQPQPHCQAARYRAAAELEGLTALVTGGDSGIGLAVSVLFAKEHANVAITFLPEEDPDAQATCDAIGELGQRCVRLPADPTTASQCERAIEHSVAELDAINIHVRNAEHPVHTDSLNQISDAVFNTTFRTHVYPLFWLTRATLRHMKGGGAIIATCSKTGLIGAKIMPDYSATKGAINAFAKSLAVQLADKGNPANALASGWSGRR